MKKIFSFVCTLAVVLCASAFDFKPAKVLTSAELSVKNKEVSARHFTNISNVAMASNAPAIADANRTIVTDYVEAACWGSGDWQFIFFNGDNFVASIDVQAADDSHIAGTYSVTGQTIYTDYSYIVRAVGDTVDVTGGSVTITYQSAGTYPYYQFSGSLNAGGDVFTLNATLAVPAYDAIYAQYGYIELITLLDGGSTSELTGDTIQIACDTVVVSDDYLSQMGIMVIMGANMTHMQLVGLYLLVNDGFAGTYSEADLYGSYSFIEIDEAEIGIASATITITAGSNNQYTLHATIVGTNGVVYVVTLTFTYDGTGGGEPNTDLDYDSQNADFNHNYSEAEVDTEFVEQYGVVMVEAYDETSVVGLYFWVNSLDNSIIIPAGTYPINSSRQAGSVWASTGVSENSIIGSFAGMIENEEVGDVWFMVDGNVTVSNNNGILHIVVAATNSYGRSIQSTIDVATGTGVEDVETVVSAEKQLMNGQVVIEKNGTRYNVLGTIIE